MSSQSAEITRQGLWNNNVALVQLLGLCPLLAVTSTTINGIGLGLATLITLVLSNTVVSMIRNVVRNEVRLPVFVLIIASIVTIIELLMQAWFYQLYLVLGIFIPLIVTNCSIIARAEGFASRNPIGASALDGFMMGLGFLLVLTVLGAMREVIGAGTVLAHAELLFGEAASALKITLFDDYRGFLIAVLPPGAFFGLALLIVGKNLIEQRLLVEPSPEPLQAQPSA